MLPDCLLSGRQTMHHFPVHKERCPQTAITETRGRKGKWMDNLPLRTFFPPTADHFNHKQLRRKSLLRSTNVYPCESCRTFPYNSHAATKSNLWSDSSMGSLFYCLIHVILKNCFVIASLSERGFFQPIKPYTFKKCTRSPDEQNFNCVCYTDKQKTSKYNPETWTVLLDLNITW